MVEWHELTAWACPGHDRPWSLVLRLGIVQEVQEETNDDIGSDGLGYYTLVIREYAHFWNMHTKCSTEWPHEAKFWIWPKYFMEMIQITVGTSWWWWCAKWSWFVKIQKVYDLVSVSMLPLGMLILSNWDRVNKVGQHKKCSRLCALGWGEKSWEGLV
jgi:hypothetical protein